MSAKTNTENKSKTMIKFLNEDSELKLNEEELLKRENLSKTIVDMSLPEEIRVKALEMFYEYNGHGETLELVNKLAGMYQFSGIKLLRSYLYKICVETNINPFLKLLAIKTLCSYNENDDIGYTALNIVYPTVGKDVSTPIKVDVIILLMKCKKYRKNARDFFIDIINDNSIEVDYRYKTILNLENLVDKDTRRYFIEESCWEFLNSNTNPSRYRVLSAQYLLQKCKPNNNRIKVILNTLLSFANDNELDYNIRADAADVLMQLGDDEHKAAGTDIILLLGRQDHLTHTLYDNAQNVHVDEIDNSAVEIIEFLASMPTLRLKNKEDLEYEKKTGKTVIGIEITFDYIRSKINKIIEMEKKEKGLEKKDKYEREEMINISLNRIDIDRALYSKFNVSLKMILIKVWTYISGHDFEQEIRSRLLEELEEMAGTCSTGYANRLANSITGFGDFTLRISWRDQIIANLGGRLNARAKKIDDIEFQEKVLMEMTIKTNDFSSRKNFLKFFRQNILSIREEMYQEFKSHLDDTSFDLHFRAAVSNYECGSYV